MRPRKKPTSRWTLHSPALRPYTSSSSRRYSACGVPYHTCPGTCLVLLDAFVPTRPRLLPAWQPPRRTPPTRTRNQTTGTGCTRSLPHAASPASPRQPSTPQVAPPTSRFNSQKAIPYLTSRRIQNTSPPNALQSSPLHAASGSCLRLSVAVRNEA